MIWHLAEARCRATLEGHAGPVRALAVLDDGHLASGSLDETVKIWDVAEARCVTTLGDAVPAVARAGNEHGVLAFAVLDAGRLAIGLEDKTITLWSAHDKGNDEGRGKSTS